MNAAESTLKWLYREQLKVDDKWSIQTPNGFTWWADKNAQTIEITGEESNSETKAYFIRVKTDLFQDIELNEQTCILLNALLMPYSSMAGPVYDSKSKTLSLCSHVRIHEGIKDWMAPLISTAAVLQIGEARIIGPLVAKQLKATFAETGHPKSGVRLIPDELANIIETLFGPTGKVKSQWSEMEFKEAVTSHMNKPPSLGASYGEDGLTVEFPYGERTSLCQFIASQPHPRYGSGLLFVQSFPVKNLAPESGATLALELNSMELNERPMGYGFGSYCYKDSTLHFNGFLPNAAYRPNFLPSLYYACAGRAVEMSRRFAGDDWSDLSPERIQKHLTKIAAIDSSKESESESPDEIINRFLRIIQELGWAQMVRPNLEAICAMSFSAGVRFGKRFPDVGQKLISCCEKNPGDCATLNKSFLSILAKDYQNEPTVTLSFTAFFLDRPELWDQLLCGLDPSQREYLLEAAKICVGMGIEASRTDLQPILDLDKTFVELPLWARFLQDNLILSRTKPKEWNEMSLQAQLIDYSYSDGSAEQEIMGEAAHELSKEIGMVTTTWVLNGFQLGVEISKNGVSKRLIGESTPKGLEICKNLYKTFLGKPPEKLSDEEIYNGIWKWYTTTCPSRTAINTKAEVLTAIRDLFDCAVWLGMMGEHYFSKPSVVTEVADEYALACKLATQGKFAEAESILEELLRAKPKDPFILYLAGQCARSRGNIDLATARLEMAVLLKRDEPNFWHALGIAQQLSGRLQDSEGSFGHALKLEPDMATAFNSLGISQRKMGKLEIALHNYDAGVKAMIRQIVGSLRNGLANQVFPHPDTKTMLWAEYATYGGLWLCAT